MASDPRAHAPCGLKGQKVKFLNSLKIQILISNMKIHWTDSWPVITQHFDIGVLVMKLRSA